MIHSRNFVHDHKYRKEHLSPVMANPEEDRPLIVQFCGNDPTILAQAAEIVKDHCDGVDINLGCPQAIAKRGHYGAFLQNDWELLQEIVGKIKALGIPVSCKIRRFPEIEKTVRYAKMLEAAGCWMLTLHGRTIDQKGPLTGLANWEYVKAVKQAVRVPVLSNGNIQYLSDVHKCLKMTGVDGIMSAEGNLHNPALFAGIQPPVWEMAMEYLKLVEKFPCPLSYTRGHLFKLFYHLMVLDENMDLREELARADGVPAFERVTLAIKERYEEQSLKPSNEQIIPEKSKSLPFPPWICQPYERPPPIPSTLAQGQDQGPDSVPIRPPKVKTELIGIGKGGESVNLLKRMKRKPNRDWDKVRVPLVLCANCVNPVGPKCDCCKKCCRDRCYTQIRDCESHKIFIMSTDRRRNSRSNSISEI
jgi:tRNA-dihydrouridine synthase 1